MSHAGPEINAVEPHKFADFNTVADVPLANITKLRRVQFVMKVSEVVKNSVAPQ